jgi:bacterioferritin
MKGSVAVINQLNAVLKNELISINQTFLHSRMFNNWGLKRLGEREYKKSIKDMNQADALIERTLFLEGLPNLQDLGKLRLGEDTEEILSCELALATSSIAELRNAIALCEGEQDYLSREILDGILAEEEDFLDWLETQGGLIRDMGLENYIQSQS